MNLKEKALFKDLELALYQLLSSYTIVEGTFKSKEFEKNIQKVAMRENNQELFKFKNRKEKNLNLYKLKKIRIMEQILEDLKEITQEG
ncbi:MAG: hypothetical protein ACOCXL_00295 [Halanaerobium sp.]